MRKYTSFVEIERDLKYLRLKSRIEKEELKLGFSNAKQTISKTLSPVGLITNTLGAIVKSAVVYKAVDYLIGIKPVKKEEYEED